LARRNVNVLAVCQGLFQTVQALGFSATSLAGHALLGPDKSLATVPIFMVHFGILCSTLPASFLMQAFGRRAGFSLGAVLGISCGIISAIAIYQHSFWLLCVGTFLQGVAAAFAWYYRFAAADAADASYKAKAVSYVMAGGVIAGFVGPQLAKWTVDLIPPYTFLGIYLSMSAIGILSLVLVQGLRIPPLTAAQKAAGGRPIKEIASQPTFIVALLASMLGYGVMTLVMSVTPLAMLSCGYNFIDSATVIQVHIIGMFLPAFFTGSLINRFGVLRVIIAGAMLSAVCAAINLSGVNYYNFLIANWFVGIGWNLMYVGGSVLLTETYQPAERAKVQGTHDFCVYGTTALASGSAGLLNETAGWALINAVALPMMVVVILGAIWLGRRRVMAAA
jgi:MFS family permease